MTAPQSIPPSHAPLSGVRVLDLSRLLPGPFCSLVLADLGASVDKLEDPHAGDYLRVFPPLGKGVSGKFAALNRDKRSICLDLKAAEGRTALLRLLPQYDVLIESFRPGVLDRLKLGTAIMHAENPRLVVCAISGYGAESPYRARAGHDLNYLALSGVLALGGPADRSPAIPPVQVADLGGGALTAAVGILAALFDAQRTGRGRTVDVSMCEGALGFLLPTLGDLEQAGMLAPRGGDVLTGGVAAYGVYRTKDDRYLSVAPLEPKFWAAFCRVVGRKGDPSEILGGPAAQAALRAEIDAIIATKTRDEWAAAFSAVDACCEPVLAPDELAGHPIHAETFVEIDGARYPHTALHRLGQRTQHTAPPRQGEHSANILAEAGYSAAEIAALTQAGVTRQAG